MMRAKLMGISQLTISNLSANEYLIPNPLHTQFVRWKRKPIWLPTAKSKMFKVPKRTVIPPEEAAEITRLYNNYRTYMRSIIGYIIDTKRQKDLEKGSAAKTIHETADFKLCNEINDKWNRHVAMCRNIRLKSEGIAREAQILQKLLDKEQRDKHLADIVDEKVRKLKQEATTFITAENIEKAVEEALAVIVNHETALDLNGVIYKEDNENIDATTKQTVNKQEIDTETKKN